MIRVHELTFSYGKKKIFEGFNLASEANFLIIKGPSGCGKTTLLKLLTDNLELGKQEVLLDVAKKSLILQEDALFPWMTGIENILKITGLSESEVKNHVLYNRLSPFIEQYAYQMSYGQRRMVELFRVVLFKPDLLCLDEPFNFLDPINRKIFLDYLLQEIAPKTKIVMTTHYNEDTTGLNLPTLYFDGQFPVKKLLSEHEFKNL